MSVSPGGHVLLGWDLWLYPEKILFGLISYTTLGWDRTLHLGEDPHRHPCLSRSGLNPASLVKSVKQAAAPFRPCDGLAKYQRGGGHVSNTMLYSNHRHHRSLVKSPRIALATDCWK